MLLICLTILWFVSVTSFTLQFGFIYNKARANDRETLTTLQLPYGNAAALDIFWAAFRADDSLAAGTSLRTHLKRLRVSACAVGFSGMGILLSLIFPGVFERM